MRTSHPDKQPAAGRISSEHGQSQFFESLDFLLDSVLVFAAAGVEDSVDEESLLGADSLDSEAGPPDFFA
jgi:hypothetical protein